MQPEFIEIQADDNVATAVRFSKQIRRAGNDEDESYSVFRDISQTNTLESQVENQTPKIIDGIGKLYVLYYIAEKTFTVPIIQEIYVLIRTENNKSLKEMLEFLQK